MAFKSLKYRKMLALSILPVLFLMLLYIALCIFSLYHFDWFLEKFPAMWLNYAKQDGLLNSSVYVLLCLLASISVAAYITFVVGIVWLIIVCFFAPVVVQFTQREFYPTVLLNPHPFLESLKLSSLLFIKTLTKFLILSMFCFLFNLIGLGFIGMLISIIFYFRFFSLNLNYEIALNIMRDNEYKIFSQYNVMPLFFLNSAIFAFLYIPVVNFFVLPWQMLVLSHFMLNWYAKFNSNQSPIEIIEADCALDTKSIES
ncbi:EI24 domain-containing protein [Helicobacter sp. MIT 14-3879]|uniref:EI24 domain-containing protein n=1 Tax=Helicobacter sp. MIT 14-3879 TaxID=2040649 RepID=UPI0038CF68C7